jgi:AraC family transcriptional activator of pobA
MDETRMSVRTLAQLGAAGSWRLNLAHDRPYHLLLWFTRGQGRMMIDGRRRGLGAHNAVFVPAGSLFSLDPGRQSLGWAVIIPAGTPLRLPDMPWHLRVLDARAQSELSGLIEAAQREQATARALVQEALEAHVALMSVWLRRQISEDCHIPAQRSAAERLSRRFASLVPRQYATGAPMAFYARELGVTATHLTRAVKAATGKTAADLLAERLVHAARDLLEGSNHPAKNIAQHLGFGSAAYFTRFIKHHVGRSPSQLRPAKTGAKPSATIRPPRSADRNMP